MKKLIIPIFLAFFAFEIQAQNIQLQAFPGHHYISTDQGFVKGVEGSPYLGDWQKADVYFTNGSVLKDLMVRYNVYKSEMMYQEMDKTYVMSAPDSILQLKFPEKTFVYSAYEVDKGIQKNFFELVQPGKVNLLVKYEIEVIPANYNVALMSGNKNDQLSIVQKLYMQRGKEIVPLNKKERVFELLGDKKAEVSSYMGKEKLSYKKKKDMIQLLEYYDQL